MTLRHKGLALVTALSRDMACLLLTERSLCACPPDPAICAPENLGHEISELWRDSLHGL
jgi:hypothetical protein